MVLRVLARNVVRCLREWLTRRRGQLRVLAELGLVGGAAPLFWNWMAHRGAIRSVKPRHAAHRLAYRVGSSDLDVLRQIFIDREYAPLCDLQHVGLVVDCGANVGYSSAFFLSTFPSCRVVAIEPDPGNFAMLERNLRAFGDRVALVRGGIWSCSLPLKISHTRYRDGREWTVQVRPCSETEEPDLQGIGMESLASRFAGERISLLKMDVEGAEAIVFAGDVDWLDRVDAIAIELHDDSVFGTASDVFHAAIRGRGFHVSRSGELTMCRRSAAT